MRRFIAVLLCLNGLGGTSLATSPEDAYLAAHRRVTAEFDGDDYEGFAPSPALKEFWTAVDDALAAEGPDRFAALAKSDEFMEIKTLPLTKNRMLVAVNWGQFGHLDLLDHAALLWSSPGSCENAAPCYTTALGLLPPDANGALRFYVQAEYARIAGGTSSNQLSLWRWKDGEPRTFYMTEFAIGGDAPQGAVLTGNELTITSKGHWDRLSVCGSCDGRQQRHRLRITPTDVVDLGTASLYPELDDVDALLGRLAENHPTDDLATPEAASTIEKNWHTDNGLFFLIAAPIVEDHAACIKPDDNPSLTFRFATEPATRIVAVEPGLCG